MNLAKTTAAILLSLTTAPPAAATSTAAIVERAAEVPHSEVEGDEWPFETLGATDTKNSDPTH